MIALAIAISLRRVSDREAKYLKEDRCRNSFCLSTLSATTIRFIVSSTIISSFLLLLSGFFQSSTREEIEIGRNSAAFKGREEYRPSRRRRPLAFKKFTSSHLSNWPLPVWFLIDHNGLVRLKTCRRWTLYVRNVVHSFSARSNFSSPPSCIILQTWWHGIENRRKQCSYSHNC